MLDAALKAGIEIPFTPAARAVCGNCAGGVSAGAVDSPPSEAKPAAFRDPQNGGHGNLDAVQAYMFLIERNECLDGFSPIEVLTGVADIAPEQLEALSFFAQDHAKRVEFIAQLATAWEAKVRGW